jgi:hypothetical protein
LKLSSFDPPPLIGRSVARSAASQSNEGAEPSKQQRAAQIESSLSRQIRRRVQPSAAVVVDHRHR